MGYDLYCIICGCLNYDCFRFNYKEFIEPHKDFPDIKDKFTEKDYNKFNKICKYLDNVLVLLKDGRVLEGCDNDTEFFYFACKNVNYPDGRDYGNWIYTTNQEHFTDKELMESSMFAGKIIHKDCYEYIKKKFNKKLTYADLNMIEKNYNTDTSIVLYPPLDLDYGIMTKYWSTKYGFLIHQIIADDNTYLLYSPLDKNVSNNKLKLIDSIYKQLMAKNINISRSKTNKRLSKKNSKKLSRKNNRKTSRKKIKKIK